MSDKAEQAQPAVPVDVIEDNVSEDGVAEGDVIEDNVTEDHVTEHNVIAGSGDEANANVAVANVGDVLEAGESGGGVEASHANDRGSDREPSAHEEAAVTRSRFDIVKQARSLLHDIDEARERQKTPTPGPGSTENYLRKMKLLNKRSKELESVDGTHSICHAIATYASKSNSFYAMKAAAKSWARGKVVELLAAQDRLQRVDRRSTEWARSVELLGAATQLLRFVDELTIAHAREISGLITSPAKSKRSVLKKADDDWRRRYFEATAKSSKYRDAGVLLGLCGMRPKELEKGVLVRLPGNMVAVKIDGAKVTEHAGQPWRGLFIPKDRFPTWFTDELASETRKIAAPSDAMRSYLYRLSTQVFPPKGKEKQLVLSAYVLRHAVATDLRQAGWSAIEIASVLGEVRAETTRWYGLRWRGSMSRRAPEVAVERGGVSTARKVIARDQTFLAEKKLDKLAKAASRRRP